MPGVIFLGCLFSGYAFAESETTPYMMVDSGKIIPVKDTSDVPRKASGQTLYLSSSVSVNGNSATPTPTPEPKPTPSPSKAVVRKDKSRAVMASAASAKSGITVMKSSASAGGTCKTAGATEDDPGDDYGHPTATISDPIQPVNRSVFWCNHQLYHYVFSPLNKTYKFVLPHPVRTGISNAVNNVEYPVRFVNDLLQWKPAKAGLETEKFLLNTTAGIGGLVKVSNKFPALAEVKPTDTAATFAKWGIPSGCYIVWPVIGPKSLRDTVGFAGDIALNPASWFTYGLVGGLTGTATLAVSAPQTVGNTSDKVDTYETLTHTSIDRYNAVKSAYIQNRKKVESQ